MFCEKCGEFMPEGSSFCTKCGAPAPQPAPQPQQYQQGAPQGQAYQQAVPQPQAQAYQGQQAQYGQPQAYGQMNGQPYQAQPQYQQAPYQAQPQYQQYGQKPGTINGVTATSVLVWGIIGLAFACTYYLSFLGIIFSAIARGKAKRYVAGGGVLCGKAKVGNILALVGLILAIVLTAIFFIAVIICGLILQQALYF